MMRTSLFLRNNSIENRSKSRAMNNMIKVVHHSIKESIVSKLNESETICEEQYEDKRDKINLVINLDDLDT